MHDTSKRRRGIAIAAFALVLAGGAAVRMRASQAAAEAPFIVEEDERLRDAVAALPPAASPAVIAPSRVAVWASPALRRAEADRVLVSRRLSRRSAR